MHELSKTAQDLLSHAAGETPLNEDQTQRIWSSVERRVQWPGTASPQSRAIATSGVFSASRAHRAPKHWRLHRWARTLWLSLGPWGALGVTAVAAALSTVVVVLSTSTPVAVPPNEPSALNVREVEPGVPQPPLPEAETPLTPTRETPSMPTAPVAPSAIEQAAGEVAAPSGEHKSRPARRAAVTGSTAAPPASLQAEVASLDRVYRRLDAAQYEHALKELDRHEQTYPQGALGLEARAAGWIARCKLKPQRSTRDAASTFLKRLGKTPLAQRVQRACADVQRSTEVP